MNEQSDSIKFEIAGVAFYYVYDFPFSLNPNSTTQEFLVDSETLKYDVVNSISKADSGSTVNDYLDQKARPIFWAPAWTAYDSSQIVFHTDDLNLAIMNHSSLFDCNKTVLFVDPPSIHPLPICITGLLLQRHLLSKRFGLILHGATLNINGFVGVFSGNSGVGKSTISSLLKKSLKTTQISDDRLILLETAKGDFCAYGNPFDGKIDRVTNTSAYIDGLFFLSHGRSNSVARLTATESMQKMLTISLLPYWDEALLKTSINVLHHFVSSVPCYSFCFIPDSSAVECLQKETSNAKNRE